jgi:hypothetical protein
MKYIKMKKLAIMNDKLQRKNTLVGEVKDLVIILEYIFSGITHS